MHNLFIIYGSLTGTIFFSVLYTNTFKDKRDLSKNDLPYTIKDLLPAIALVLLLLPQTLLSDTGTLKINKGFLENTIKAALQIGLLVLPFVLMLFVVYFETIINFLLGKRQAPQRPEKSKSTLLTKLPSSMETHRTDPLSIEKNPLILPYNIF
ncbi:MAG: hypothetical protein COW65_00790 [Cytophagales bacterium CG18_big_fil_WC_8_21_14_2_50_42_9]|nr:MAG: hypothetical protein COW65_00790 [Cytophagales bacterium CG18_big_fil_WC_8_21_14_2_50_42_9]